MKRKYLIFLIVVVALLAAACVTTPVSPKSTYLKARLEFNTLLQQYLTYYKEAPPQTQAQWKAQIDPIFKQASAALDLWGMAIKSGQTGIEEQQKYLDIKNKLIDALFPIMGGSK